MESKIDLTRVLFLDIETVPQQSNFEHLEQDWQALWLKKAKVISKYHPTDSDDNMYQRAGIYAEFGKIVCISAGFCFWQNDELKLRIKSFSQTDEKELLKDFGDTLNQHFYKRYHYLCAHNGQEFDFPYICRRTLLNGLQLPKGLKIMGNKPWENKHLIDTMKLWAFGDI
ncbi:MAG: 3'-5' exonuclease, partial [Bacteroidia bacterium]